MSSKVIVTCARAIFRILLLPFILSSPAALAALDQLDARLGWVSWRDISAEAYQSNVDKHAAEGYRPVDFEVRSDGKNRLYSLIMRREENAPKWASRSRLTDAEFKKARDSYRKDGFRPIDLETHVPNGTPYYGAIWIKDGIKNWASYRNLSTMPLT